MRGDTGTLGRTLRQRLRIIAVGGNHERRLNFPIGAPGLPVSSEVSASLLEVPGGTVFVRRWSRDQGSGSPIVLLHDSLGSVDQWRDFPEALAGATGREVIAYDRLGFGKSTRRWEQPSVHFVSEEALTFFPALRRALGIQRLVLFGHSVGGAMALVIAASQREACEAVITEAAQAFVEPCTLSAMRAAKAQFGDPEQLARIARWHGDKARWVLDAWTEVWLSPEFSSWSLDQHLGKVRCPVLAIHGDSDEYGSVEFPRRITRGVAGPSQLAILEHCGHVPHRARREEVLQLTSAFLDFVDRRNLK
jgi:pimeloyl-ACP methyl ester carboxylesterase